MEAPTASEILPNHYQLNKGQPPQFATPENLSSCPDLYILSNDGFYFEINAAVFASSTNLKIPFEDEYPTLITELGHVELRKILRFCVSGIIEDEADLFSEEFADLFRCFGIEIQKLQWNKLELLEKICSPEPIHCSVVKANISEKNPPVKVFGNTPIDDGDAFAEGLNKYEKEELEVEVDDPMDITDYEFIDDKEYDPNDFDDGGVESDISLEDTKDNNFLLKGTRTRKNVTVSKKLKNAKRKSATAKKPKVANATNKASSESSKRKKATATSSSQTKGSRRGKQVIDEIVHWKGPRDMELTFQCPMCNFGTNDRTEMKSHWNFHNFMRKLPADYWSYNCLICGQFVENEEKPGLHYLREHQKRHFKCKFCDRTFRKRLETFMEHVEEHMNPGQAARKCVHCGLHCKNGDYERMHLLRWGKHHTKACIQCNEPMSTWEEHVQHVKDKHDNQWIYRCGRCMITFNDKFELKQHRRAAHDSMKTKTKPIESSVCELCGVSVQLMWKHMEDVHGSDHCPCPICNRVYKHPNSLSRHMSVHSRKGGDDIEESTVCKACGLTFSTVRAMKQHYNQNHRRPEEFTFQCRFCPEKFHNAARKANHEHNTHIKPIKCLHCQRRFKTHAEQEVHMKICAPNKTCEVCSKTLGSAALLRKHILRMHTPDSQKPYKCPHCEKGFVAQKLLNDHINTHTNAMTNKCRHCGKGFRTQGAMFFHEKKYHPHEHALRAEQKRLKLKVL